MLLHSRAFPATSGPPMWNERQWRERRIGTGEIVWSWVIVALIVIALAAWAGAETLMPIAQAPIATHAGG